jgi:hypothetical protein
MNPPAPRYHSDEKEPYQFACPDCWAVRTITYPGPAALIATAALAWWGVC